LRELIDFDYKFPAERTAIERELSKLGALSPAQVKEWFQGFGEIHLSPGMEAMDWVNSPAQFVEQLSSYLWTTHQLDAFRTTATEYAGRLRAADPPELPAVPQLTVVVIGQAVAEYEGMLFRKLRPHGCYYSAIKPANGLSVILEAVADRAKLHPAPYRHWYIDGGEAEKFEPILTCISYQEMEPVRAALLRNIHTQVERPGMGPEALRTLLAQTRPEDLGLGKDGDPVVDRFKVKLLTEGSGTQVFSTSFAQWAARETLRRAHPTELIIRFAPRQRQRPMNELLGGIVPDPQFDPMGSLFDGDMAAYYTFLNQQRLPGAEKSSFLVWFEGHNQALAVGPTTPRGTESSTQVDLKQVLSWMA
jgi:hypothetical protein